MTAELKDHQKYALLDPRCDECSEELTITNAQTQLKIQNAKPHYKQRQIRWCDPCRDRINRETRSENAVGMLPETFQWADFSAPELGRRVSSERAIAAARTAVSVPRVVFVGPAGSGKTSLACASLKARYIETGQFFTFAPASMLCMARARHKLGAGDPEEIVAALAADVLLIDDLGFEKPGPTSVNDVETVIYERHLHARPTWVTTWMRSDKARERYGDGIARRLFEGATIIDCGASK